MIKIQIMRDIRKAITGFRVAGHANTAPHGEDIVCAGVSALTQSAILGLSRYLGRQVNFEVASGKLIVELSEADELTGAILETMLLGLQEIANNYPNSVRIEEHRR